ncbi:MAG TPA: gamma-glutamyltransferase, partial [Acidimicrobiales bacterium]|nr:gamma-glutamyltransferase [Acidimicrobiales bacterium]
VRLAGGSVADAAVAASAVLAVTTPHMCGMGGDLFAVVVRPGRRPEVLNASGRAGSGADPDRLRADHGTTPPLRDDVRVVTVPGCVDGWLALHAHHGSLPLADVLADAIGYAEDGFPASPLLAATASDVAGRPGTDDLTRRAPIRAGDRIRRPGVARALRAVAAEGRDGFYGGEFGEGLVRLGAGEFVPEDLARDQADWVEPLRLRVWDHDLWTPPPNSQGYLTLSSAWIAQGLPLPAGPDDPGRAHLLVEATRQAGHDRPAVLHEHADGAALLDPDRLAPRRERIDPDRAGDLPAPVAGGGTIFLAAADHDGNGVALIQSNAAGFGSHLVEPRTGIFLHNRGIGFSLEPGHPAEYGPGRRPPHTLAPLVATRPDDGSLHAVVGTMGGDSQPQVVLQLLARLLAAGQDPATAVAAGRWVLGAGQGPNFGVWRDPAAIRVRVEAHAPPAWTEGLTARGHRVEPIRAFDHRAGHAHVIVRAEDHLAGAADPRAVVGGVAVL